MTKQTKMAFDLRTPKHGSEQRKKTKNTLMRIPNYSRSHPVIPRSYVPEWKTDMKNRKLIIENADIGMIPHYEHDEQLFLDKREQMTYNVENRVRVNSKCPIPDRYELLRPEFPHETSKYQSELMQRTDAKKPMNA